MKVLVTGGAGFLGINLCRHLADKGCKVTSLDIAPFDYEDKDRFNVVQDDIRNPDIVEKLMKENDFVVHCASALPLYPEEEIRSTGIKGSRILLESALRNKIKKFVFISSSAVYGIPDHHPLVETDKLVGVGPYGETKVQIEEMCEEYRKKGLVIPIIRPKSFVGRERLGVFAIYFDWIKSGKNLPMIGMGKNRYQLLDVDDLDDAIYLCLTKDKKIVNDTFNIGAKVYKTMKEDFQSVLDYAGYGKRIIPFPASPLIWTLRVLELFKLSPLYKWVYETAPEDSFLSIEKAEKKLGYKPQYSNQQALVKSYCWYVDNFEKYENSSGVSHRVPWKQGILRLFKVFF